MIPELQCEKTVTALDNDITCIEKVITMVLTIINGIL